jgi:outer membrane protein assembly factor BamD
MMRGFSPRSTLVVALLLAVAPAACKSGGVASDPILRLAAAEALTQGKDLMARGKYARARPFLAHAYEAEPNSLAGREGLLLLADSYFLDGGGSNWIQAEAKYRDFLNRFPTSEQAAYAQFQIAGSLAKRIEKPNRDQTSTRKALESFQELLRLYPTSEYAAEAQATVAELRNHLADAEFVVGDFYLRYRYPGGAIQRFESLLEQFPGYDETDKVLYHLGVAYTRSAVPEERQKAREVFARLAREYPDSPWTQRIPDDLPPAGVQAGEERVAEGADGTGGEGR